MIHQIVITSAANNSVTTKNYVVGRCKVKLISVHFIGANDIVNGKTTLLDDIYILQSNTLFQSIPSNRVLVCTASENNFRNALECEAIIASDIDLTILTYDTKLPPSGDNFEGLLLTVDITPIA
jgi:hypothetical protein